MFLFVPLAVPWDTILDPGGQKEALIGLHKIPQKVAWVFLSVRHFPFCPFGNPSGSHLGSWWGKARSWEDLLEFSKK